jgi:diguanylate cyclase (GGDEF)-like protein
VLIEPDGDGGERLWVGATADGLGLYEHGRWHQFTRADGSLPDSDVRMVKRAIAENGESALWIGQRGGYLLRLRNGPKFEQVATPWEKQDGEAVMDILGRVVDGVSERWIATRQSGIWRWRGGAWTGFRPDDAAGQWRTTRLLEQIDDAGRSWLWATSNQGLARFDGRHWLLLGREEGLPDVSLSGMTMIAADDGHPVLWLGSVNAGIVRVDVADPAQPRILPADLPPPPDPTAYGAVRDSLGHIYICTNFGVQRLTPHGSGWASQTFSRSDGLLHEECNTNAQFVDARDRFWTGTLGGLSVFDPSFEVRDTQAKPLRLTAVRVDGGAVAAQHLRIPSGSHELRAEFALLSWQREGESRFRSQLVGYESAPGAWRADDFRAFNALPPGDYVLRIEARDYAGNLSTPIELPVAIVPAWWQRSVARLGFALAALLVVYGLLRWRTRSMTLQRRRLEEEVAERTAELNTANSRLLELSYQDALTGLSNRRSLLERLETMTTAGAVATLIFVDVDHFKAYNDHFGHPAGDEALCRVAATLRAVAPAEAQVARYGGEEFACLLRDADLDGAVQLAERIRAAVETCDVPIPGTAVINHLTISAGVATRCISSMDDAHQLLRDADNALYYAKNDGRNCVRS